jgi:hypothetical protein
MVREGRVKAGLRQLAVLVCASAFAGCAASATTGAFVPVDRIEKELHRRTSTKTDVQRVLGTPKGYGSMVFPQDHRELEVWYYEDIAVTDARRAGEGPHPSGGAPADSARHLRQEHARRVHLVHQRRPGPGEVGASCETICCDASPVA